MESLKQQASTLRENWKKAYKALRTNPKAYQQYLPGANVEQLNEAVDVVLEWFERVRPPAGFAPTYHVARSLAGGALTSASTAAEGLARAEYSHLPSFVEGLNQVLASLHSLLIYGDPAESEQAIASLGVRLTENLALIGTAQREIAEKSTALDLAGERLKEAAKTASEIAKQHQEATKIVGTITKSEKTARDKADAVDTILSAVNEKKSIIDERETTLAKQVKEADDLKTRLLKLTRQTEEQQALITALLPKGASAGLASAFGSRVAQLERTKTLWVLTFVASMLSLAVVAGWIIQVTDAEKSVLWIEILERIPLAAPFIWLGWFSAIQYGNTLRVQEDYAFKEATSKAFAGFKDHLEHMARIADEDGASAMAILYAKTIDALSREPLRIFQGIDQDAAPSHALLQVFKRNSGRGQHGTPEG